MAALQDLLLEIDTLYRRLKSYGPLKPEDEDRLWKRFRLDWNYNSNHIEGNTITYGQTELLVMFDKTSGEHEMRELEEMKAHDAVVLMIREYARDRDRDLTEADIRQWNKTILVRPFWSPARTPSGEPTRKFITPGEYKKEPNSVLQASGEMFHYATPEETPVLMQELLEWYRQTLAEKQLHIVEIAALMHYKMVRIHPFDDSNGRTSRLLMNYVLLKNGYPPVIVKSADKRNYLFALNKADVGDLEAFVAYVAAGMVDSLEASIEVAEGRPSAVEEPQAYYKSVKLWGNSGK